jgi:hypothetical protein
MDDKPRGLRDNKPRGIQVNSEGIPFYVEFGTNNVASIDPERRGSANTRCWIPLRDRAVSPSPKIRAFGTRILLAASWEGSIPRPAR